MNLRRYMQLILVNGNKTVYPKLLLRPITSTQSRTTRGFARTLHMPSSMAAPIPSKTCLQKSRWLQVNLRRYTNADSAAHTKKTRMGDQQWQFHFQFISPSKRALASIATSQHHPLKTEENKKQWKINRETISRRTKEEEEFKRHCLGYSVIPLTAPTIT